MEEQGRITTRNWDLYDTRHVVYKTKKLSASELEEGYNWAYKDFYRWTNIFRASMKHDSVKHKTKHFMYSGGWKKFEAVWNLLIKTEGLSNMLPLLESVLAKVNRNERRQEKSTCTNPHEPIFQ